MEESFASMGFSVVGFGSTDGLDCRFSNFALKEDTGFYIGQSIFLN